MCEKEAHGTEHPGQMQELEKGAPPLSMHAGLNTAPQATPRAAGHAKDKSRMLFQSADKTSRWETSPDTSATSWRLDPRKPFHIKRRKHSRRRWTARPKASSRFTTVCTGPEDQDQGFKHEPPTNLNHAWRVPSYLLPIYLCIHLSIYPPIHLSIYPSIHPSIHPIYLSIHLSIYLFIYLPIHTCICLSVYLSNLSILSDLSYLILSYPVFSCLFLCCLILSYLVSSYGISSYPILSYPTYPILSIHLSHLIKFDVSSPIPSNPS